MLLHSRSFKTRIKIECFVVVFFWGWFQNLEVILYFLLHLRCTLTIEVWTKREFQHKMCDEVDFLFLDFHHFDLRWVKIYSKSLNFFPVLVFPCAKLATRMIWQRPAFFADEMRKIPKWIIQKIRNKKDVLKASNPPLWNGFLCIKAGPFKWKAGRITQKKYTNSYRN